MAHFIGSNGQATGAACYAEAAFFDGFHFAHIAARDEAARLAGKAKAARVAWERRERGNRRMGGRYGMAGRRDGDKAATA